jgi:hypothetical protein
LTTLKKHAIISVSISSYFLGIFMSNVIVRLVSTSVFAATIAISGVAQAQEIPSNLGRVGNLNGNVQVDSLKVDSPQFTGPISVPVSVESPQTNVNAPVDVKVPVGAVQVDVAPGAVKVEKGAVNLQMVMPSAGRSSTSAALTPTSVSFEGFSLSHPKGVEWFVESSVSAGVVPYSTHGDLAGAASGSVSAGIRGNIGGGLSHSEKIAQANSLLKSEMATVKMLVDAGEPESAEILKADALARFFKTMHLK